MKPKPTPVKFTQTVPSTPAQGLPLTPEYQGMLLRLLLQDREFGDAMSQHVLPAYFTNQVHAWAWAASLAYRAQFGGFPSLNFVINVAYQQQHAQRDIAVATLCVVRDSPVMDEEGLRALTLEFVKRNVFRQAHLDSRDLYNAAKYDEAYDLMRSRLAALDAVSWAPPQRAWLGEGFIERHIQRQDPENHRGVTTGFPELDFVLEGGLHLGEMGFFLARPKAGKTTLLCNLGSSAVRMQRVPTYHANFEGNLAYTMNRYDTIMLDELYSNVKRGDVDAAKYARAAQEAQWLRGLCVVRDFTQGWGFNAAHIDEDLKDLKKHHGFVPKLIVVDYVDLLRARESKPTETENQKAAAQDLKTIANRGYAVWSVSQVQRPRGEEWKDQQEVLTSAQVADAYAKIRIADFIGSINQTEAERQQNVMRLYAELYRDGVSGKLFYIASDFARMSFRAMQQPGMMIPSGVGAQPKQTKQLGYGAALQQSFHGGGK